MMGDRKGKEADGEGSDWDSMSETAQPPARAQPATGIIHSFHIPVGLVLQLTFMLPYSERKWLGFTL